MARTKMSEANEAKKRKIEEEAKEKEKLEEVDMEQKTLVFAITKSDDDEQVTRYFQSEGDLPPILYKLFIEASPIAEDDLLEDLLTSIVTVAEDEEEDDNEDWWVKSEDEFWPGFQTVITDNNWDWLKIKEWREACEKFNELFVLIDQKTFNSSSIKGEAIAIHLNEPCQ